MNLKEHRQYYYNVGPSGLSSPAGWSLDPETPEDEKELEQLSRQTLILNFETGVQMEVTKFGIQAPPGTKFLINGNSTQESSHNNILMVGKTGVFELESTENPINIVNIVFIPNDEIVEVDADKFSDAFKTFRDDAIKNIDNFRTKVEEMKEFSSLSHWNTYIDNYNTLLGQQERLHENFLLKLQKSYNFKAIKHKDIIVDIVGTKITT